MREKYYISLLRKYRAGKTTPEEERILIQYYDLLKEEVNPSKDMSPAELSELKIKMRTAIDMRIAGYPERTGKVLTIGRMIKAAAAVVLITGAAYIYNTVDRNQKKQDIVLTDNVNIKENRLIRLPDGSTVIVSAGSKLNYPSSFEGMGERKVFLEGQAYFDIRKDTSKPFVVYTEKVRTIVLGTAFNVKAMLADKDITVTVTRGKVKVSNDIGVLGLIEPNQQIVYNKRNETSAHKVVETKAVVKWKEADLLFDEVTVEEAAELLSERFNVTITFQDSLIKSNRFSTIFHANASIEEVLTSICTFNNATYDYDRNKRIVSIKTITQ